MATNAVNVGKGRASGMFYVATAGTAIPSSLTTLPSGWTEVGFISEDGMELQLSRDVEDIKDWSNTIRRTVLTDHDEKASGSCISTTADALEELFGSTNITESSGTITVNLSATELPPTKAYLFIMKDGDDLMCFGCSTGQISVADNVSFTAGDAIAWPFEITAQGSTGMKFVKISGGASTTTT